MSTVRFTGNVLADGSIRPPQDVKLPPGAVEVIVVTPEQPSLQGDATTGRGLADWFEQNSEHWGDRLSSADVNRFTGRGE